MSLRQNLGDDKSFDVFYLYLNLLVENKILKFDLYMHIFLKINLQSDFIKMSDIDLRYV